MPVVQTNEVYDSLDSKRDTWAELDKLVDEMNEKLDYEKISAL